MADSSFQEVILDGPLHEVVVDGRLCYALVVFDRVVVVCLLGREVGDF